MAQKGNIGVTTENIFPVIKKFLYSDHDSSSVRWFPTLWMLHRS